MKILGYFLLILSSIFLLGSCINLPYNLMRIVDTYQYPSAYGIGYTAARILVNIIFLILFSYLFLLGKKWIKNN